jgi:hypothetical protein
VRRNLESLIAGAVLVIASAAPGAAQLTDSTASVAVETDSLQRAIVPDEVVAALASLLDGYIDTPEGMGIIPTGMEEAKLAGEYVRLAGQDSTNLNSMVRNMAHVLHAIDPNEVASGFGLGYGVKRAAEEMLIQAQVVLNADGLSDNIVSHVRHVPTAAYGALARADEAIALARRIERATTPEEALPQLQDLAALVRAMAWGSDSDRDGRIGYGDEEAGLAQATYHIKLLRTVEGIGR